MTQNSTLWKRNLLMLWLSQLLVMAGFAAMSPFVPLFMKDAMGIVDEKELAMDVSLFNLFGTLAYAIFCPIWGKLSDRFGTKPMLLRGTFVTAFFFPMMGYVTHPGMLVALRFITAACAGTTAASNILLVKTVPDERQGFALGLLGTAVWGGAVLGQMIGGVVVDLYGYKVTFWACGVLYLFAGVCCLFAKDAPKAAAVKPPSQTQAAAIRRYRRGVLPLFTFGVWVMLVLMFAYSLVRRFEVPYFSMLVELITGPEKAAFWTGIIGAATCVGAVLSGVVIGYLADRWRPQTIIVPSLALAVVMLVITALTGNLLVMGVSRTLMFFFAGSLYPVLQKLLSAITPPRKRGKVFGWSSTFGNAGIMMSTVFSGWTIFLFGTRGVFLAAALLTAALIPAVLWGLKAVSVHPGYSASGGRSAPVRKRS